MEDSYDEDEGAAGAQFSKFDEVKEVSSHLEQSNDSFNNSA